MSPANTIKAVSFSLLVLLLVVAPVRGASKTAVIKIATLAPEGSSWIKIFDDLNVELKKKTNN